MYADDRQQPAVYQTPTELGLSTPTTSSYTIIVVVVVLGIYIHCCCCHECHYSCYNHYLLDATQCQPSTVEDSGSTSVRRLGNAP